MTKVLDCQGKPAEIPQPSIWKCREWYYFLLAVVGLIYLCLTCEMRP